MISLIVNFKLEKKQKIDQSQLELIEATFSYWRMIRMIFKIELIFINDFSDSLFIENDFIFPMIGEPKNFNQPASRNYGARIAKGDHLIFTDIDHILYGDFFSLESKLKDRTYLTFPRFDVSKNEFTPINKHKNTFFIKKDDFIGYNEDFCGNYGHDDSEFLFRLNKTHKEINSEDTLIAVVTGIRSKNFLRDKLINQKKFELMKSDMSKGI